MYPLSLYLFHVPVAFNTFHPGEFGGGGDPRVYGDKMMMDVSNAAHIEYQTEYEARKEHFGRVHCVRFRGKTRMS